MHVVLDFYWNSQWNMTFVTFFKAHRTTHLIVQIWTCSQVSSSHSIQHASLTTWVLIGIGNPLNQKEYKHSSLFLFFFSFPNSSSIRLCWQTDRTRQKSKVWYNKNVILFYFVSKDKQKQRAGKNVSKCIKAEHPQKIR